MSETIKTTETAERLPEKTATITREKIESLRKAYRQWPSIMIREITDEGEGVLINMTYQPRECGCAVIGNGTLEFPLTVKPCTQHE